MAHKIPWVIAAVAVVGAAVVVARRPAPVTAPAPDGEIARRLERLESAVPRMERTLVKSGAQLGAMALAGARMGQDKSGNDGEDAADPEARERQRQQARERAARELKYYDQLDERARAGGGAAVEALLRKNVAAARDQGGAALELQSVACGPELCRVEVKPTAGTVRGVVRTLIRGMGGLSMRPQGDGPPVYYVAAPDQQLPRMDL